MKTEQNNHCQCLNKNCKGYITYCTHLVSETPIWQEYFLDEIILKPSCQSLPRVHGVSDGCHGECTTAHLLFFSFRSFKHEPF